MLRILPCELLARATDNRKSSRSGRDTSQMRRAAAKAKTFGCGPSVRGRTSSAPSQVRQLEQQDANLRRAPRSAGGR